MQYCAAKRVGEYPIACPNSVVPGSMFCAEHGGSGGYNAQGTQTRKFDTGATRDQAFDKPDYEGYLSPLTIERFGQYMLKHQIQSDGTKRDSDNWQKGIPLAQYMKSLLRHAIDLWKAHRGYPVMPKRSNDPQDIEELLCAIIFNASGYLHETVKKRMVDAKVKEIGERK
jgi:hypothetical protein